jgi:hypothetical protein
MVDINKIAIGSPVDLPEFAAEYRQLANYVQGYVEQLKMVEQGLDTVSALDELRSLSEGMYEYLAEYLADERLSSPEGTGVAEREQLLIDALPGNVYSDVSIKLDQAKSALKEVIEYYETVVEEMQGVMPQNERLNAAVRKLAADLRAKAS